MTINESHKHVSLTSTNTIYILLMTKCDIVLTKTNIIFDLILSMCFIEIHTTYIHSFYDILPTLKLSFNCLAMSQHKTHKMIQFI